MILFRFTADKFGFGFGFGLGFRFAFFQAFLGNAVLASPRIDTIQNVRRVEWQSLIEGTA